ncbi:MAG: hypothetical protein PHZ23_15935 [Acidiphilium sp.]|nr:hypothetical protein [Acidiphilium sp.]
MTALAKWAAALSYTAAFGTEINSLAAGSTAIGSVIIDNTTTLATDGYISWSLSAATTAGTSYLSFYLLPLNEDGTTYGDNTATGTATPDSQYYVGNAPVQPPASGNVVGSIYIGNIPATKFKLAVYNGTGNAFGATAGTISFASNDINLNG